MCNINDNAVQGHLSENYLTKYFRHKIFAIYSIRKLYIYMYMYIERRERREKGEGGWGREREGGRG